MISRVILFGGSFNPVHFGHLIAARSAAEQLDASCVVLIPAAAPPHKNAAALAAAEHRLAMLRLAVEGDPLFEIDDLELRRAGPSYTFDTVTHYRGRLGDAVELCWIIGADSLPELAGWHRIDELVRLARIITVVRPGNATGDLAALQARIGRQAVDALLADRLSTPAIEISASDIRARRAAGRSIRYLTPQAVVEYILRHGLYATTAAG